MREVIFRGKSLKEGKWTYGYLFKIWGQSYIMWGETNGTPNLTEVDSSTCGQYTGLNDKYDNLIYEKDIVFCHDEDFNDFIGVVTFKNGHFMIKSDLISRYFLQDFEIEVIGNIYNNPGLLKAIGNTCDNPELLKDNTP